MRKVFSDILNAAGVIAGDWIEGWGSRISRAELMETIREQAQRLQQQEEELDRLHEENVGLRVELQAADDRQSYVGNHDIPVCLTPDQEWNFELTTKTFCDNCKRTFVHCICIPF
jgi:hypothetical protein